VGAAIEQNHDDKGIIWTKAIAPFEVVVCGLGWGKSEAVREQSEAIYSQLKERGVDVILDDRDLRPGIMFAEWELIGVPLRVTVGDRGLAEGIIELLSRKNQDATKITVQNCIDQIIDVLREY